MIKIIPKSYFLGKHPRRFTEQDCDSTFRYYRILGAIYRRKLIADYSKEGEDVIQPVKAVHPAVSAGTN